MRYNALSKTLVRDHLERNSKTRLSISDIKLRRGRAAHNVKTIAPGDTSTYIWYARGVPHQADLNFSVSLKSHTPKVDEWIKGVVHIRPALPKLESQVVPDLHTYMYDEHLVLGNKNLRLVLVHNGEQPQTNGEQPQTKNRKPNNKKTPSKEKSEVGFEYYAIFVAKGSSYQQIATSKMIAEATYLSKDVIHNLKFVPNNVQLAGNSLGESIVSLTAKHEDSDGVTWSLQLQLILTEDAKRIKTIYRITTDRKRDLLAFRGQKFTLDTKAPAKRKLQHYFPVSNTLKGMNLLQIYVTQHHHSITDWYRTRIRLLFQ